MIRLTNLTKRYGKFTAVDGINLEIRRGELFGFLGPNGAGKTTTMRMIAGILQPTSGTIEIAGDDIADDPIRAKSRLGFIPDRPFVYDKLTGAEFLRFVAALYGQDGEPVERRMDELLDLFELMPWKDELVESYSHGMRQKLIISSALLHRPEVDRGRRADGRPRPQGPEVPQGPVPGLRRAGRHGADEHPHPGYRRGDVRPDRHHRRGAGSSPAAPWRRSGTRPRAGTRSSRSCSSS